MASRGTNGNLWVTRLRANLATRALDRDLRLEATTASNVDNVHSTRVYDEGPTNSVATRTDGCSSAPMRSPGGAIALFVLTVLGLRRIVKRRRG